MIKNGKSIKIVTLWSANNYGAFLQAYALSTYLKNNNYDVCFLDKCSKSPFSFRSFLYGKIIPLVKRSNSLKQYYTKLNSHYGNLHKSFKICDNDLKTDFAIVGSDEIWNVSNPYFKHLEEYIGIGLNSEVVISYAASCNLTNDKEFENCYGNNPFRNFTNISVRDESTKKLVNSLAHSLTPTLVLDPTFLLENYNQILIDNAYRNYILLYGYSFSDNEKTDVLNYARKNNLRLLSVGPFVEWADEQIPASPGEFLGLVKNADFVCTSTFHGSVFSIIFNKNFCSFARNNNKIIELLKECGLSKRDGSRRSVEDVLSEPIDYKNVNEHLNMRRSESEYYLLNSLKK